MNTEKIKAIFFDFGGTLDHDGNAWGIRLFKQFNNAGLIININDFNNAEKKSMNQLFNNRESALLNYQETIDIYIYWVIKNLNITIKDYKKALVNPFYLESLKYIERNRRLLEKFSDKFTLGIISNNFGNCESWCDEFKIKDFFSIIIDSNIVGFKKPDKRIFKIAIKKIRFSLDKCIYIGDKYKTDIEPTLELGMLPIWINNNYIKQKVDSTVIKIDTLLELENIFKLKDKPKLLI